MTLWVNGEVVAEDAAVIRADDHGLVVGDGVFETMTVEDGVPFALTRHLNRLQRSAAGLGIDFDEDLVRAGIKAVLADRPDFVRLRVTLTGGPSPYGSDRGTGAPTVMVATGPLSPWPATTDVAIVPWVRNERAATAGLKTTSYADNVVALRYAHDHGAAEAIFANTRDEVCEGTGSNVFYEYGGRLVTPPLSSGCLAGVTRELLIEWLAAEGSPVEETVHPIDTLRATQEAFITSTTRDVMPIGHIDGVALAAAPGPLTRTAAIVFERRAAEHPDP
jgi:branched-subunit amino acid aminotransferase/4-amino-4-deoxychorismate lyase